MSHFDENSIEQALLDWAEAEMKNRSAPPLYVIAALVKVIGAICERNSHHE